MYNSKFTKNIPKGYWYFWWTDPKFIHTVPKMKLYGDEMSVNNHHTSGNV